MITEAELLLADPAVFDDYDPRWAAWNAAHPHLRRSVGAMAADGEGEGDGGDAGEGEGDTGTGDAGDKDGDDNKGSGTDDDGNKDTAAATAWRDSITNADAKKFAERFNSAAEMAAFAHESRQKLSNAIFKPGKDASDEDKAAYRKGLGVPDKAEDYAVNIPEDLPEGIDTGEAFQAGLAEFKNKMHAVNAPPEAVQMAVEAYLGMAAEASDARDKADEKFFEETEAALRKEWGGEYDANKAIGERGVTTLAQVAGINPEDLLNVELKGGRLFGSYAPFMKFAAVVGRRVAEDTLRAGTGDPGEASSIQDKIDEITKRTMDDGTYNSDKVQKELQGLYQQLHGTAPADGRMAA